MRQIAPALPGNDEEEEMWRQVQTHVCMHRHLEIHAFFLFLDPAVSLPCVQHRSCAGDAVHGLKVGLLNFPAGDGNLDTERLEVGMMEAPHMLAVDAVCLDQFEMAEVDHAMHRLDLAQGHEYAPGGGAEA
jgi:hypothetical protein